MMDTDRWRANGIHYGYMDYWNRPLFLHLMPTSRSVRRIALYQADNAYLSILFSFSQGAE